MSFFSPLMKELLEYWKLEVIVHMPRASLPELLELWIEVTVNHLTEGTALSCSKDLLFGSSACEMPV